MPELKGGHQCSAPADKRYIPALRTEVSAKTASRSAPRDSTCRAVVPCTPARSSTMTTRLSLGEAKKLAADSGARDTALVASHLVLCTSVRDAKHSIAQLRHNRPEYFAERHSERGKAWNRERRS